MSLSRIVRDRTARLGSSAPVIALTGTASSIVLDDVRRELGISDSAAIIRAKRLDRPELELQFLKVPASGKQTAIAKEVTGFLDSFKGTSGGLLVFTQHVNGSFGVFDIATNLAKQLQIELWADIRVYSGEAPKKIVCVRATHIESVAVQGDDGVHQELKWTPWNTPNYRPGVVTATS